MSPPSDLFDGPYPTPPGIHCICMGCGALCDPLAWERRGRLCARCAFPTHVTNNTHTFGPGVVEVRRVYVNGVEVVGAEAIEAALRARNALPVYIAEPPRDPDPIRDAIDRACTAWARDEFKEDPST